MEEEQEEEDEPEADGIQKQKKEPHTKMCGITILYHGFLWPGRPGRHS